MRNSASFLEVRRDPVAAGGPREGAAMPGVYGECLAPCARHWDRISSSKARSNATREALFYHLTCMWVAQVQRGKAAPARVTGFRFKPGRWPLKSTFLTSSAVRPGTGQAQEATWSGGKRSGQNHRPWAPPVPSRQLTGALGKCLHPLGLDSLICKLKWLPGARRPKSFRSGL